jgi:hypothetical protein
MIELPTRFPEPGFYHHYKHIPSKGVCDYAYEVVSVGFHTEDDCREHEKWFVNYRPLYTYAPVYQASLTLGIQCIDNRPLKMWLGDVTKDGKRFARFAWVKDPSAILALEKARTEMYAP